MGVNETLINNAVLSHNHSFIGEIEPVLHKVSLV
jgi:hypothetical protein